MCLDEALLQAIGAAHQFEDAIFPVDKPPDGFLKMLKTGLGGHLKHGRMSPEPTAASVMIV